MDDPMEIDDDPMDVDEPESWDPRQLDYMFLFECL